VATIEGLVDKGYAYPAGGDVYFRVASGEGYGKLSHRTLDGMMAGARVEVDQQKENPMDFVLWKGAKSGEPAWGSPWGPGRPGWHIECTSMSLTYLGDELDIHGGGADLIFPHHENEIAQSEAFTGREPFSRYWVHNGLLQLGRDKMSKSLGNLVSVEEALERFDPDSIRLYFLGSHYRSRLSYSNDDCAATQRGMDRLRETLDRPSAGTEPLDSSSFEQRFLEAMDDDLNTPRAVAALFDLSREINRYSTVKDVTTAQGCLRNLGGLLGLTFKSPEPEGEDGLAAAPFIQLLLEIRTELRKAKQYALADRIREGLDRLGVAVEDTPDGAKWQYQPRDETSGLDEPPGWGDLT
ncbi:MAG: cysteine--tRNA ligase, partial [Dehalococcoidia bacterium]|nr:cysteine--tRNA ligase [Dehalococcoidia bacterium]